MIEPSEEVKRVEQRYEKALDNMEKHYKDALDKIRAEIDSHCSDNRDRNDGLYIAMKIIDKYKAESGVSE